MVATGPASNPMSMASGQTIGRPKLTRHCSIAMTTPGHNRSGFLS